MSLARYNQYVVAVVGTLSGLAVLLVILLVVSGPFRSAKPAGLVVDREKSPIPPQNLVFCPPQFSDGSKIQYLPVAVVDAAEESNNPIVRMAETGSMYSRNYFGGSPCGGNYRLNTKVFNVVVRDVEANDQRLLLTSPGQIESIAIPSPDCAEGDGPSPCNYVLWNIRSADSNGDGIISRDDSSVAYISDLHATSLLPVTPNNATVLSSMWSAPTEEFIFQVRMDLNGDGKFTNEDGSSVLYTSSVAPEMATEAVNQNLIQTLKKAIE